MPTTCAPSSYWRTMLRLVVAALLVATLAACGQVQNPASSNSSANLRPAGSPDVVIIDFSGRCDSILNANCTPPFGNNTYLKNSSHLTRQAVAQAFMALGYSVQSFDASAFVDTHYSAVTGLYEPGYADADTYLQHVEQDWIANFSNPTQVVLLAHSHGTDWASLLAWNHPEVHFAYFIYLDAICFLWPADNMINQPLVQDYYHQRGQNMPWPLEITGTPCDLSFQGLSGTWDLKDVVPWNVDYGLEVRSENFLPNYTWDPTPNIRPDGSTTNLASFYSAYETHDDVSKAGSAAVNWVVQEIKLNGLPGPQALSAQSTTSSRPVVRRAPQPAPEPFLR